MTFAIAVAVAAGAWLAAALCIDVWGARQTAEGTWDAIVVPGALVRPDGTPSGALARRTEHAVRLWRAGVSPLVVFTGGTLDGRPTEARAAADHAHALGLPRESAILEPDSTSTEENARFAARVCSARRVLVVTDSYHVLRCRWLFARSFAEVAVVGTRPPPRILLRLALREVLMIAWYAANGAFAPRHVA